MGDLCNWKPEYKLYTIYIHNADEEITDICNFTGTGAGPGGSDIFDSEDAKDLALASPYITAANGQAVTDDYEVHDSPHVIYDDDDVQTVFYKLENITGIVGK